MVNIKVNTYQADIILCYKYVLYTPYAQSYAQLWISLVFYYNFNLA